MLRVLLLVLSACALALTSAGSAPVPKLPPAQIPFDDVLGLLGKSHLTRRHHEFRLKLGTLPVYNLWDTFDDDAPPDAMSNEFRLYFIDSGVEMVFDDVNKCAAVRLTAKSVMGLYDGKGKALNPQSAEYAGLLPEKITFSDSPAEVRKKLGDPDRVEPGAIKTAPLSFAYTQKYAKRGIELILDFEKQKESDEGNRLRSVLVVKADP
jgi:hypothetical protein